MFVNVRYSYYSLPSLSKTKLLFVDLWHKKKKQQINISIVNIL